MERIWALLDDLEKRTQGAGFTAKV